jgi:CubicO group peptidase (beta-lactamase class C family)
MKRAGLIILVLVVLGAFQGASALAQESTPYWPTQGWRTSTPEAQGMDSGRLAAVLTYIHDEGLNVHSVLVIRNGYLVTEAYLYPYDATVPHDLRSATKSFTSALIGIALDQGYIQGIDVPLLDFFPDRTIANLDDAKRAITLEDVLTMSSGLDWPGGLAEPLINSLFQSRDWAQFVLDRPMADEPGSTFAYNSGGSHLLTTILKQRTGMPVLDFARKNLFDPLGFGTVSWTTDLQDVAMGGSGLFLTPRDMAKFGYLYLKDGQWDGQQIVPAEWVATSTRRHIAAEPIANGYGYHWWVDSSGYYTAAGYGGQHIFVQPELNVVVVFTSGMPSAPNGTHQHLLDLILESVQSSEPLPDNPVGLAALQAAKVLSQPDPAFVVELPDTARHVSGKTITLPGNGMGWQALSLIFPEGGAVATITVDGSTPILIGLDGAYRAADLPPQVAGTAPNTRIMGKGSWETDTRLSCEFQIIGAPDDPMQVTLDFEGTTVHLRAVGVLPQVIDLSGTLQG